MSTLFDTDTTGIQTGDYLKYDGTNYVRGTLPEDNSTNIVTINTSITSIDSRITTLSSEMVDDISSVRAYVESEINTLITGAPATLDTLKEIADVLGDPTDASGGIGTILSKINDISGDITSLDTKVGDTWTTSGSNVYNNTSNVKVGIGTDSPTYPLHVVGSVTNSNVSNVGYLDMSGAGVHETSSGKEISIYASKSIWAGTNILASSDLRIKKDIVKLVDEYALETVRKIDAKYFSYKDEIIYGGENLGFIAQDIFNAFPIATSKQKEFIPNEFRRLKEVEWEYDDGKYVLRVDDLNEPAVGDRYKFIVSNDLDDNETPIELVIMDDLKSFKFDDKYDNVFLYGKMVDDFLIIDKQKIYTLHHGAIKHIDKKQIENIEKIERLEKENVELRDELNKVMRN